jgi:hypothetical protein
VLFPNYQYLHLIIMRIKQMSTQINWTS